MRLATSSVFALAFVASCGGNVTPPPEPLDVIGLRLEQNEVCIGGDSRTAVTVHVSRGTAPRKDVTVTVDSDPDQMLVEPLVIPADRDDGELGIVTGAPIKTGTFTLHVHAGTFSTSLDVIVGPQVGAVDESFGEGGYVTLPAENTLSARVAAHGTGVLVLVPSSGSPSILRRFDERGAPDLAWGDKGQLALDFGSGGMLTVGPDRSIWVDAGCDKLPCRYAAAISADGSSVTLLVGPNPNNYFGVGARCIVPTSSGTFVGGYLGPYGYVLKLDPQLKQDPAYGLGIEQGPGIEACAGISSTDIVVGDTSGRAHVLGGTGLPRATFGSGGGAIQALARGADGRIYMTRSETLPELSVAMGFHVYEANGTPVASEDEIFPGAYARTLIVSRANVAYMVSDRYRLQKRRGTPLRALGRAHAFESMAADSCGRLLTAYVTNKADGDPVRVVVTRLWP